MAKTEIFLFLLRLGKISPTQIVKRSQSLGDDVIEGLSRFEEEEPFPARILLYDSGEELQEVRQDLVDYPWQEEKAKEKEVTFLHLPKVEMLSAGEFSFDFKNDFGNSKLNFTTRDREPCGAKMRRVRTRARQRHSIIRLLSSILY